MRARLLELAAGDDAVVSAALTGSYVATGGDEWSDIDVALGFEGDLQAAIARWTDTIYRELGAIHHWDLPHLSSVYRVYLLPDCLEVDVAFTPAADFGPRGPKWRTVFGETVELPAAAAPDVSEIAGLCWHHVLHARACIERGTPWQAEWLISALRDHTITLACARLGLTTAYAKGADGLPDELRADLEDALVRSLDDGELRRALRAATSVFAAELDRSDAKLAARLDATLRELAER